MTNYGKYGKLELLWQTTGKAVHATLVKNDFEVKLRYSMKSILRLIINNEYVEQKVFQLLNTNLNHLKP